MPYHNIKQSARILCAAVMGTLMVAPVTTRAQFSPGPLSSAHEAIDQPAACVQCHEPQKATSATRCFVCHKELGTRVASGLGYHGRDRDRGTQCATCHAEHGGRKAAIVRWPGGKEKFDHSLTGYVLTGGHAPLKCDQCHLPALIRAADVRGAKDLRLDSTYLGLSTRCAECHGDVHRGQFAEQIARADCAACHRTDAWRGVVIDHAKTHFPLTGKHTKVECDKCHYSQNDAGNKVAARSSNSFVRYAPLPFADCATCHADPHKGKYPGDCARCHATAGWNVIASGAFDHDKTRYPLRGLHRNVECVKCHTTGDLKKKIPFERCVDCHADRHGGQLMKSPSKGACDACHSVEGFTPPRYGTQEHEKTAFPLRGAHLAVACNECHKLTVPDGPRGNVRFRMKSGACMDCHVDEHAGQFAASREGADCRRCHVSTSWRIASFDHKKTRFALVGAHARAACTACHFEQTIGGKKTARYRPLETACKACHATQPRPELGRGKS